MLTKNLILMTDSYKASHWKQYPLGSTDYYGYIESRGSDGVFKETVFFGLQIFLKEYLSKPITQHDINEASEFFKEHGEPFNKEGWQYILDVHNGYIPIRIKAVPEGLVIPTKNALVTVESTDDKVFWVGSYFETTILRAVWYGTTVATNSYYCKQLILDYLEKSSDDPKGQIMFKLHDFGGRGVSSRESACIGGAAHLVNFMGSDTVEGVVTANKYYNAKMAAFSIPAAEHSTITAWGRENEVEAYRNMILQYAKPNTLLACVSDSYDIFNACEKLWGEVLKEEVIKSKALLVIRPDSGDPASVVLKIAEILGNKFGYTRNNKGYKVLNNVRIIQGDGINLSSIKIILGNLYVNGWSTDNIAFGMGGALLQGIDRDTLKFAMKCSAMKINGEWVNVFKSPVTDPGKNSKAGRLTLFQRDNGEYFTDTIESGRWIVNSKEVLVPVFENGKILKEYSLDEVRKNSSK